MAGLACFAIAPALASASGAPQMARGEVSQDGTVVTLVFDKHLATDGTPLHGAFTVKADGEAMALKLTHEGQPHNPIRVENQTFPTTRTFVLILLNGAVASHQKVTVSYAAAQAGTHPLRGKGSGGSAVADIADRMVANKMDKAGAPLFRSAAVDGTKLKVTFDEYLSQTSVPAGGAFAVTVGGAARAVNAVRIDGPTVTLTLASAVVGGETVKVGYTKPPQGESRVLVDGKGNDVETFSNKTVTNNSPMPPPQVVRGEVSDDGTVVTLLFDKHLATGGTPLHGAFTVKADGEAVALKLTHEGQPHNPIRVENQTFPTTRTFVLILLNGAVASHQKVTVSYAAAQAGAHPLRGQGSRGGAVADFADRMVANKVDKAGAPLFRSAAVDGTALTVTFDEFLIQSSVPNGDAFTVTVNGAARAVSSVSLKGSTVTLTLASAVLGGETVKVGYTRPAAGVEGVLRDRGGSYVETFSDKTVTNNAPVPDFESVTVDENLLKLTFGENLRSSSVPAASAFTVTVGGAARAVADVVVSYRDVKLTLASAVLAGDSVKVRYIRPDSGPLTLASGAQVASFGDTAAENNTPAAVFESVTVDGTRLTLTFEEDLRSSSVPAAGAFAVTAGEETRTVAGVVVSYREVKLTLASAVGDGDAVKVRYAQPASRPLTFASGARVPSFGDTAAENNSVSPTLESAAVDGWRLTLTFSENLRSSSAPAASAFGVTSGETGDDHFHRVDAVTVAGTTVTVTVGPLVTIGHTVKVRYTRPADNPLTDATGNTVATFGDREVTNNAAAPAFESASMNGRILKVVFNENLNSVPFPKNAFSVSVNGVERTPRRVNGITENYVLLDFLWTVAHGDTVTVSYDAPEYGEENRYPLHDAWGYAVESFSAKPVTNDTPEDAPRALVSAAVDGTRLTLAFNAALDAGSVPAGSAFTVTGIGADQAPSGVSVFGATVTLTLDRGAAHSDNEVRVNYAPPASNPLRGSNGVDLEALTNRLVRNDTGNGPPALTAQFVGVPAEHDRRAFSFELRFSENFPGHLRYKLLRDEAFQVTNGRLRSAKRVAQSQNRRWTITVKPTSFEDVTVTLLAATDCPAPGSVCTDAGRMLSSPVSVQVAGPAMLSAADAEADEGPDAAVAFEVRLSREASGTVTVNYATLDGTAKAGRDYTAARGTLTFAPGEVAKTVSVAVLDDALNEDRESFALMLSNASGARIADRDATGAIVNRYVAPPPLTASFVGVPAEHDRRAFSFELRFSENFPGVLRSKLLKDEAFEVTNGRVRSAKRVAQSQNQRWTITVKPNSFEDVTVTLPAATDCAATGAVCTEAGRMLSETVTVDVPGPVRLSVADAEANEGPDAEMAFEVSLSRAASGAVTVDYATADGTATAGEDYTAAAGTLTFAVGETEKTVTVPLFDDALDEGRETFSFRLSNAAGARIGDGEALGTIVNADPLQRMWLSRFGRTVASHVTDAVSDRLVNPLTGAHVTVGGQSVNLVETEDEAWLGRTLTAVARSLGASEGPAPAGALGSGPGQAGAGGWPGTGLGVLESPAPDGSAARTLLLGSAFHLAGDGDGTGPGFAAWGRVTAGGFDGEAPADAGSVRIDGETTTGILGADAEWNRLLAGVAVSMSEGEGRFDQPGVDSGTIESTMTTVSPYARFMVSDRVSAWGLAGWGTGDMTVVQAANENQPERVTRTDLGMRLAAVGGRGALMQADEDGGIDLALKADAFYVETESEAVSNEGGTTAQASRVRLALEGSRAFQAGGAVLTPALELGLRHDVGDAETGTGVELGGRVSYVDPASGLSVEASVRTLVAHADSDYEEWGVSGAVRLAPGERGRGLSFSLAPTWGTPSSGVDRLWSAHDARGVSPGGEFEPGQRLEGELGYGLALFGDRFTGTPNVGFGLSDTAREYRIGWRLTSAVPNASGFEVHLDATRREAAHGNPPPEYGAMVRGAVRW